MELRQLTPEDRPARARLMAEAFGRGELPGPTMAGQPEEPDGVRPGVTWGIFGGSRLAACATVHGLHLTWGDHDAPMGGVAGVACVADQRGRGHVARLLERSLIGMRETGQYLSALYPFAYAFYRRHGWDWVGEWRSYDVPTAHIPSSPYGRDIQTYDGPDALEVVKPIYAAFARRYRGMTTREDPVPNWWHGALRPQDNRTTYVHVYRDADTGLAEGYLTFRFTPEDTAHVPDFFANSPSAYAGLLSVLHYYGTQVKTVFVRAPADDPLPLHVMHWDLKTEVEPLFMGRVVDVKAAFEALHPRVGAAGKVFLRVADPQCDWNDGVWAVTVEDGHVSAKHVEQAPGVVLDIQTLSQGYWGQPSLAMLRSGGRVAVADEAQYRLLESLLPPACCYSQDHF